MDIKNKWDSICLIALEKYDESNFDYINWLNDHEALYDHLLTEFGEQDINFFKRSFESIANDELFGIDDYIRENPQINEGWVSSILWDISRNLNIFSFDGKRIHPLPAQNFVQEYMLYKYLHDKIIEKIRNRQSL